MRCTRAKWRKMGTPRNRPALTRTPSSYLSLFDFSEIIGHVSPHSTCSRYLVSVVTGGNPGHDDR